MRDVGEITVEVGAQPLKGRLVLSLAASLKRCPDTNQVL